MWRAVWVSMWAMWVMWTTMSVGRALLFSMLGPIPAVISACHQKENTEATSLWFLRYTYHVRPTHVDTWKWDIRHLTFDQ